MKIIPITGERVFDLIPPREPESNKGSYGRVLCVAGSARFRGAAALCAEGALRTGAGIVTLASTEAVIGAVAARVPECTFVPCAEKAGGIDSAALPLLLQALPGCKSLVMGCGLGNSAETAALVRGLCAAAPCPTVLDADALNAVAGDFGSVCGGAGSLLITPHPGEMARLLGCTVAAVQANRPAAALGFAQKHGCIVILKGHQTLVADPGGQLFVNTSGNAGMARGGSGDVLSGMLAALLAAGLAPLAAALCAVWLHGAAGDLCAKRLGQMGMLPHDLLLDLGALFAQNGR